ncbi:putative RNase h domain protein [Rosellinia necatrix]|uniref:ribonuclease H n=1 Tax=Rosellinia necatrix TaxID=77044 RepID=A0A1W2TWS6_ROSNE|nr:putative RNase h domain protein [Rosellinia necatrix]
MPRGYYLAQGFIPLDEHSSDDDEGPCELPDGRIVCGPHGHIVCGRCCVDYSFMEDILSHDEDEDEDDGGINENEGDGGIPDSTGSGARYLRLYLNLDPDIRFSPPSSSRDFQTQPRSSSTADVSTTQVSSNANGPQRENGRNLSYPVLGNLTDEGIRRGTGRVFPTIFTPPSSTIMPTQLFRPSILQYGIFARYIHRDNSQKVLLFTDGACLNNGQANPKAGWAVVHSPSHPGWSVGMASDRLESKGPFGDPGMQTSNRAELRAVIVALRLRHWVGEGFNTVVIATDSEYVTAGATEWVKKWIGNGWKTSSKADVKNKDLWEMLLGEVERWHAQGLSIQFWKIPREWNKVADAAAKEAAGEGEAPDTWIETMCVPL